MIPPRRGRPPTFRGWLRQHERDNSPLGDFADDVARDPAFPKGGDRDAIRSYLARRGADYAAREAFSEAWSAYEREVRNAVPTWVLAAGEIREGDDHGRRIAEVASTATAAEAELLAAAPELLAIVQDLAARVERIGPETFRLRGEPMRGWTEKRARIAEVLRGLND